MDMETRTEEGIVTQETGTPETAEPEAAEETVQETGGEPEAQESRGETTGEGKPDAQTREERARYAAERRRREQKDAVEAAVRRALEEEREKNRADREREKLGDLYGTVSPYTGNRILTEEDKRLHDAAGKAANARSALEKRGISADDLAALIESHPAVQEARRAAEQSRRIGQGMASMERQRLIDADIREIAKYDPSVKSADDVRNAPGGERIAQLVDSGRMTYLEAWKMQNFDRIAGARADANANAEKARADGKSHLSATSQRSAGETPVSIPEETRRLFEAAGFGEADMKREYAKYLKNLKG